MTPSSMSRSERRASVLKRLQDASSPATATETPKGKRKELSVASLIHKLPARYRGAQHHSSVSHIVAVLLGAPEGLYFQQIMRESPQIERRRLIEYLNALCRAGSIEKTSKKGILYTVGG